MKKQPSLGNVLWFGYGLEPSCYLAVKCAAVAALIIGATPMSSPGQSATANVESAGADYSADARFNLGDGGTSSEQLDGDEVPPAFSLAGPACAGDFDGDKDVDLDDWASFFGFLTGPFALSPGFECADFDSDLDVDLIDAISFTQVFTDSLLTFTPGRRPREAATNAAGLDVIVQSGGSSSIMVAPGAVVDYQVLGLLSDTLNEGLAGIGFDLEFDGGDLTQADTPVIPPMFNFAIPAGMTNPAGFGGTIIGGDLIQVGGLQNTINNTAGNAPFPVGPVITGVGHSAVELVSGSLTAPMTEGQYTLSISSIVSTVIREGESGSPFWAVEAAGVGIVQQLTIMVVDAGPSIVFVESSPGDGETLWRSSGNYVSMTFDSPLVAPAAGGIEIREMLAGSLGPDLSGGFGFAVLDTELQITESGTVLANNKWYVIMNVGNWADVAPFQVRLQVQVGDADNDGRVLHKDLSLINSGVPDFGASPLSRFDINGDGFVLFADVSIANAQLPSFPVGMPSSGPTCEGSDLDSDGVPDICDACQGFDDNADSDSDAIPTGCDNCELSNPGQVDCQPNGVGDVCDIDDGTSTDTNGNGTPDECEAVTASIELIPTNLVIDWMKSPSGVFDVSADSDVFGWDAVDMLVESPDLELGNFTWDSTISSNATFSVLSQPDPFGFGENQLLAGVLILNSVSGSNLLGTLAVDATTLPDGVYSVTVSFDADGFSTVTLAADQAPLAGTATVTVTNSPIQGPTIYVDASATGANNGTNWTDAFTTLQDALLAAAGGGFEIWVASGTYYPDQGGGQTPDDRSSTFQLIDDVAIYGGFAGGETGLTQRNVDTNTTVLSGDLLQNDSQEPCGDDAECASNGGLCVEKFCIVNNNISDNSYHVTTGSGTTATAAIDGFTITAGNADGVTPDDYGAGMINDGGGPTVARCTFQDNLASFAGGILNRDGSDSTIADCIFVRNAAQTGGGMLNLLSSSPAVTNCLFRSNIANQAGGGMVNFTTSNANLTSCTFASNFAGLGGGMYNEDNSLPLLEGCEFRSNTALFGGAMLSFNNCSPVLNNCLFNANTTTNLGGAILNQTASNPTISNCTFYANSADDEGGGIYNLTNSDPIVANSVFWNNVDDADASSGGPFMDESAQIHTDSGTPVVNHSIVQGGWTGAGGVGTLNSDPLFVDVDGTDRIPGTADDDLRLQSGSPAIDAADNATVPPGTLVDLLGNPRFVDDLLTSDCVQQPGTCGVAPIVDMGPFEFLRDCNGNGLADSCDFDCGPVDGPCDLPGCGLSVDCNGNIIPDACDIASCDPTVDPACDDCNLDGVPDGCEIAIDPNLDMNLDGILDECTTTESQSKMSDNWTDGGNWLLNGDYPDNDPNNEDPDSTVPGLHVTILQTVEEATIFLNETVEIDSLRILAGAELEVTQVTDTNPDPPDESGDLLITSPGNLLIQGAGAGSLLSRLLVANERQITIAGGQFTIDGNGVYQALESASDVSASLFANTGLIREGDPFGGSMLLSDQMLVDTNDNFIMNGFFVGTGTSCTPPILNMAGESLLDIGGDFVLVGGITLSVGVDATVIVGGSLVDQSNEFSDFEFLGTLIIGGGSPVAGPMEHRFEVSGRDAGATVAALSSGNLYGNIVVAENGAVDFVNEYVNDGDGAGPLTEALYVKSLTFEDGSNIVVDGCRIYHQFDLIDNAASISLLNGGAILQIGGIPASPLADDRFDVNGSKVNCADDVDCADLSICRSGRCYVPTNRMLGIKPNPANVGNWAYRISLDTSIAGTVVLGFVGPPEGVVASGPGPVNYALAGVVNSGSAFYQDWVASALALGEGYLYINDCEIVPGASYIIQSIAEGNDRSNELNYSSPLQLPTSPYGDATNGGTVNSPPNGVANLVDVFAAVQGFQNVQGAPKHWFEMEPLGGSNFPVINLADVFQFVSAFSSGSYDGPEPQDCP